MWYVRLASSMDQLSVVGLEDPAHSILQGTRTIRAFEAISNENRMQASFTGLSRTDDHPHNQAR